MEKADVLAQLDAILTRAQQMKNTLLANRATKKAFLDGVDRIEASSQLLRGAVIRESRAVGRGLKVDGTPDLRFLKNRAALLRQSDLRYSKA